MISSIILNSIILALSFPMFPFDSPENIRKPWFSYRFKGVKMEKRNIGKTIVP